MNFRYGKKEIEYLKSRDRRLGEVIDQIGRIRWTVEPDLFSAIVQNIVSQQISGSAAASILARIEARLGEITPKSVAKTDMQTFRACGVSSRKTEYIKEFAAKVVSGELDLAAVAKMPDAEVIATLSSLRGIGVWTAEMESIAGCGWSIATARSRRSFSRSIVAVFLPTAASQASTSGWSPAVKFRTLPIQPVEYGND